MSLVLSCVCVLSFPERVEFRCASFAASLGSVSEFFVKGTLVARGCSGGCLVVSRCLLTVMTLQERVCWLSELRDASDWYCRNIVRIDGGVGRCGSHSSAVRKDHNKETIGGGILVDQSTKLSTEILEGKKRILQGRALISRFALRLFVRARRVDL